MKIDDLTIKAKRVPTKHHIKKGLSVAEYLIVSCELCDNELAIAAPFIGEVFRCAAHTHERPKLRVDEEVVAFDFAPDCE